MMALLVRLQKIMSGPRPAKFGPVLFHAESGTKPGPLSSSMLSVDAGEVNSRGACEVATVLLLMMS